jgi:hypothetical protein
MDESLKKLSERLDYVRKISSQQQKEFDRVCDEIEEELSEIEEQVKKRLGLISSPETNREPVKI